MIQKLFFTTMIGLFLLTSCRDQEKTVLSTLDYSQIKIDGELRERALKNFDRLESEIYTPENVYPEKHHHTSANWAGDKEGRIILGLVMQAQATHREPKYLQELIDLYPTKANSGGYLGAVLGDTIDEQQLSGHGWLLRGLCEYYIWKKDEKVAGYINDIINNLALPTKGFHATYPISPEDRRVKVGEMAGTHQNVIGKWLLSSDVGCDVIFLDGVVQAYELFPNPETKELIDEIIARFMEMDLLKIKAQTHATLTGTRALIRYYNITKDQKYLDKAIENFDLYRSAGMTNNFENFNWFGRPEWTEPCAIVDSYMAAMQLWEVTQNPEYINDAHLIYYNALGHTQRANGGYGCDNCPTHHGEHSLKVHADEAWWCCTMRGGEGLASAINYNYYNHGDTLIIPAYHNSQITLDNMTITQKTAYPYDGKVELVVNSSKPYNVPVKLFIPKWSENFSITRNGKSVSFEVKSGFASLILKGEGTPSYEVNFDLTQKVRKNINTANNNAESYSFMAGPLMLGHEHSGEEISFSSVPVIEKVPDSNIWKAKDGDLEYELSPVFHVLNPEVSKTNDYQKQIVF